MSDQPTNQDVPTIGSTLLEAGGIVPSAGAPSVTGAQDTAAAPTKTGAKGAGFYWGTGRRKTAVARVRIRAGTGQFQINKGRKIEDYFFEVAGQKDVLAPMKVTDTLGKFDVWVNVCGGGQTGQAQAIMLGIARALIQINATYEAKLRDGKYLTRDSREVERKKPGQPGARRRFQFSKR